MSDATLFATVVAQMKHGRPYYEAMGDLLRHGSAEPFPTASVFNWRPPLLYQLASWLPFSVPAWLLFTELWAGLIILAAFLVPASWPKSRLAVSSLAVLVRELSGWAWLVLLIRHRSERRSVGIVVGLVAVYYAGHWVAVLHAQQPGDLAPASWVAWGGLPFLLRTFDLAPTSILWPGVGAWLWLALLLGVIPSRLPLELRVTVAGYLVAFCIMGRQPGYHFDGNAYWGVVILPTQILAVTRWISERGRPTTTPGRE